MIKKITFEKILYYLIIMIMLLIPIAKITVYLLYDLRITDNIFFIKEAYILWGSIPLLLICYIYGLIKKKYSLDTIDILVIFLFIFGIVSTVFAVDVKTSVFGTYSRYEGLLSLTSYYLILLSTKNIKQEIFKKRIINVFLMIGVFQVLYALLQVFTNFDFIHRFTIKYMAMGLCGNPNFFGSYMLLLFSISLILLLFKKEKIYLLLSILFMIGVTLSSTTGVFLSLIISSIFLIIFYHKRISLKKLLLVILILTSTYFITDKIKTYTFEEVKSVKIEDKYNISSEIKEIFNADNYKESISNSISTDTSTNTVTDFSNGRINLWRNALPYAKKYWLTGSGIDCFGLVFPKQGNLAYDKAHNVYLQIAITNGLFALILYCSICLIIFIKAFKFKEPFYIALYISFVSYCIQAFANISVVNVAPYFFIILGLLYSNVQETS